MGNTSRIPGSGNFRLLEAEHSSPNTFGTIPGDLEELLSDSRNVDYSVERYRINELPIQFTGGEVDIRNEREASSSPNGYRERDESLLENTSYSRVSIDWEKFLSLNYDLCRLVESFCPEVKYVCSISNGGIIPSAFVASVFKAEVVNIQGMMGLCGRKRKDELLVVNDICRGGSSLCEWKDNNVTVACIHLVLNTLARTKPDIWCETVLYEQWIEYPLD